MKDYFDFSAFYPIGTTGAKSEKCTDIDEMPIAMAYVPIQKLCKTYEADIALNMGTIFPELNKPFYGCKKWADKR